MTTWPKLRCDRSQRPRFFAAAGGAVWLLAGGLVAAEAERGFDIPMLDLDDAAGVHVIVARDLDQPRQYLGHPTTVLLADGTTLLAAFPTGHGRGGLRLMMSPDGGRTWRRLPAPDIRLHEVPTLFAITRPDGGTRVLLTTCVPRDGTFQWTYSDDDGATWAPLESQDIGLQNGIIVALASLWPMLDDEDRPTGTWRGAFHDRGYDNYTLDLALEEDPRAPGGFRCVWGQAVRIDFASPQGRARARHAGLCEPGVVRSPDGATLAMLFRPQHKRTNAMIAFSTDEGASFSDPVELPGSLTGERHVCRHAPDGRLVICFRDYSPLNPGNPSHGDWVAWVGRWEDLVGLRPGQYRVRLKNNFGNSTNDNIGDCGYTGVELLPDGTLVCTTYGHWERDASAPAHPAAAEGRGRPPFIIAARFTLDQLDRWLREPERLMTRPPASSATNAGSSITGTPSF